MCWMLAGCPKLTIGDSGDSTDMGSAGAPAGANCALLNGTFRFSYVERSGTCGEQPVEVLDIVDGSLQAGPVATCQDGSNAAGNVCAITLDRACKLTDGSTGALLGASGSKGTLTVTSDGRFQGSITILVQDTASNNCQSTYDVTAVQTR
jgi:hypothetical protein